MRGLLLASWLWLQDPLHRGLVIAFLPTVITGFLRVKALRGVAYVLAMALRFLSLITPKDVRGSWQAPFGLWTLFRPKASPAPSGPAPAPQASAASQGR